MVDAYNLDRLLILPNTGHGVDMTLKADVVNAWINEVLFVSLNSLLTLPWQVLVANKAVQKKLGSFKDKNDMARELDRAFNVPKFNWTHEPNTGVKNDHY